MTTIRVRSAAGSYDVVFERGVLARAGAMIRRACEYSKVYVVSSLRVWRHWGAKLRRAIPGWNEKQKILFDDAEAKKRLATVDEIARRLVRAGADRRCVILALGGGVVGDVAGFVAATYLRGVPLVHVPTTLVAQADSSIGGKTGVDLPEGKNLVGAFYSPKLVLADPETLTTLPQREYRSGLYEVIKYAVIADRKLGKYLVQNMPALLRRDPAALAWVIPRCMRIKARVVEKDEHEGGLRQILNFGHTFGHALESATGYRRFLHGEAVGCGMVAAAMIAMLTNRMPREAAVLIFLVQAVGPVPEVPTLGGSRLWKLLATDKKSRNGHVRWVLPRRIGKVDWGIELPRSVVETAARALPAAMMEKNFGIIGFRRAPK
jgi:3-dehydroquinate synthase